MYNFLRISFFCMLIITCVQGAVLQSNIPEPILKADQLTTDLGPWFPILLDFMELLDLPKVVMVAMGYMNDPEVLNFAVFVTSPQFTELVQEFESMDEFKEAIEFLASKGYNVKMVLDYINSALNLPPFKKSTLDRTNKKGISGLLQDVTAALPIDDIKELFENKLETNAALAELFETINSEEFVHILKKMSQNPKFKEFKKTLESYGFEFEIICAGAQETFGDYYQGIFCQ